MWSLVSAVGIATGYGLGDWGLRVRVPVRGKNIHFSMSSRPVLGPTQPSVQWVPGVSFLGDKVAGAWSCLLASGAELKKTGCIHPLPRTPSWRSAQLVKHRDNFLLLFLLAKCDVWGYVGNKWRADLSRSSLCLQLLVVGGSTKCLTMLPTNISKLNIVCYTDVDCFKVVALEYVK
jgi:hypothetical protein